MVFTGQKTQPTVSK